jgi:hypothetical protein
MDAMSLLRNRVVAVNAALHDLVPKASALSWAMPVRPGTSPIGLTLWHLPRVQDWLVNTTIRGCAEVADRPEHSGLPAPDEFGFGTGLTPQQAAAAAAAVEPTALLAYADAVLDDVDGWLATLSDADLDAPVPGFDDRQRTRAAYSTPEALAEVSHLGALPLGLLLIRPAISHVLIHLGEVETLAQVAGAGG